jgi:hypothetical protein
MSGGTLGIVILSLIGAYLIFSNSQAGAQEGDPTTVVHGAGISAASIAAFALAAGFTDGDLSIAVAIALAESGGDPNAKGDQALAPANGPSYGLWQINIGSKAHPEYASKNLFDPATNAGAAFAIYSAASGFHPWSTFTGWTDGQGVYHSATYSSYMTQAEAAVASLNPGPGPCDTPAPAGGNPCVPCITGGEG